MRIDVVASIGYPFWECNSGIGAGPSLLEQSPAPCLQMHTHNLLTPAAVAPLAPLHLHTQIEHACTLLVLSACPLPPTRRVQVVKRGAGWLAGNVHQVRARAHIPRVLLRGTLA